MSAKVVDKINAMQHRLLTNAAARKRVFHASTQKRVEPVVASQTSRADGEAEPSTDEPAPS